MMKTIATAPSSRPLALSQAVAPVTAAILLGVFVLFGVGFAGAATIHNAAHDSRHAFAFPCH
jgi:cobalt transporter subunit CbtB